VPRGVDFSQIPLIDFALMMSDRRADKLRVAAEIRAACVDVGFFYLVNHGVDASLRDRAFAAAKRFLTNRWRQIGNPHQPITAPAWLYADSGRKFRHGEWQGRP